MTPFGCPTSWKAFNTSSSSSTRVFIPGKALRGPSVGSPSGAGATLLDISVSVLEINQSRLDWRTVLFQSPNEDLGSRQPAVGTDCFRRQFIYKGSRIINRWGGNEPTLEKASSV